MLSWKILFASFLIVYFAFLYSPYTKLSTTWPSTLASIFNIAIQSIIVYLKIGLESVKSEKPTNDPILRQATIYKSNVITTINYFTIFLQAVDIINSY